ncbi:MAG: type IX secretion system outer membrane channel protein PorV [Ferruginibacter sp.]|nr:type IX secretion system outer membrane channel protein PorV [Ferruginibacter sp.]
MKQATLKLTALVLLLAGVQGTYAQSSQPSEISVVTSAVPFLRISPDARSAGMGEVGIATSPDSYSGFWNLGKLPFSDKKMQIGATYTPWLSDLDLKDVYLVSLAGYYKLDDMQTVSASLRYFSLGNIEFTDADANSLGSQRPREFAFDAGYSRKLSNKIGMGIALRYISSDLASGTFNGSTFKKGSSVAGDIHVFGNGLKSDGSGFNWGATLSNLGSKISYGDDANQKDYIPANLGLGATYTKVFDADNKITFGLDLNKLMVPIPPRFDGDSAAYLQDVKDYREQGVVSSWFKSFGDSKGQGGELKEFTISTGAEFNYKDQFMFRAGYFYESPIKGNRKYFTLGAGLKYQMIALNISYLLPSGSGTNRNPLSNTLRFGLQFDMK